MKASMMRTGFEARRLLGNLSAWLISVEGTDFASRLAMILALMAAVFHASFAALQNGRDNPWISRAAIDVALFLLAWPIALFLVPWPHAEHIWLFVGVFVIHNIYKAFQGMTYARGAYTVVYPVVRGSSVLATVIVSGIVFQEVYSIWQWSGVLSLVCGIFGLAVYNWRKLQVGRETLFSALGLAVLSGIMVAAYTTFDAYGIRQMPDPLTFVFWFFAIDSITIPLFVFVWVRQGKLSLSAIRPLVARGLAGAVLAPLSFGCVMMATRLDSVGIAAALRETSVLFAAFIGVLFLKETVGPRRVCLMALIVAGAILINVG